jgi:hypothetical protein
MVPSAQPQALRICSVSIWGRGQEAPLVLGLRWVLARAAQGRAQQSLDIISVASFALPDYLRAPPQNGQRRIHATITLHRPAKFILPKRGSGLWSSCAPASLMAMPKAAVNKEGDPSRRKHKVRRSRQITAMYPEPIAKRMCDASNRQFGARVDRPHPAHIPASRRRINSVDHQVPHRRPTAMSVSGAGPTASIPYH